MYKFAQTNRQSSRGRWF